MPGTIANPPSLKPGEEYYVAAIVGNAGNWGAGRPFQGVPPHMFVLGDALAFNTFMGPNFPLPALSNLDPTSNIAQYEQYFLAKETYDVVGFRFNVDAVFAGLKAAMAGFTPGQLGGLSIEDWLKGSHPCVKIRITAGENANSFKPAGSPPPPLTLDSSPLHDRHIAQRNLAPFDMTLMAIKEPMWKNFIVAQAGAGVNGLVMQHSLPLAEVRVYIAIPRALYERYIDPRTSKGGAIRGFEPVREPPGTKPFPDAVILQQTHPAAEIHVADHGLGRERYFGMAIGLAADPARLGTPGWATSRWPTARMTAPSSAASPCGPLRGSRAARHTTVILRSAPLQRASRRIGNRQDARSHPSRRCALRGSPG